MTHGKVKPFSHLKKATPKLKEKKPYARFNQIDGDHPFKNAAPGAFIDYPVRRRKGGRVAYFNFALAKEMGLIPSDHPHTINKTLEKQILDAFAIQIINEHDQMSGAKFSKRDVKPKKCMATRYLQLQHPTKQGRTSGDGRSIWNGRSSFNGVSWDITSCGTGATSLSPAAAKLQRPIKTGDPSVSYGCGYADLSEGITAGIMSEILHRNGVGTERVLASIEFPNRTAINIRAGKNLLRPSHLFSHLKQSNYELLKSITDYFIDRQIENGEWESVPKGKNKYDFMLKSLTEAFAKITAQFEDEYIFCWFDWDGDNCLATGGIIDYGSIRQFGLFHHKYRYDDVDRYSTTILEQKQKAKYIIQTFAQLTDYLKTKKKKPIGSFSRHSSLKEFDKIFEFNKNVNLLKKIGFNSKQRQVLLEKGASKITQFRKEFSYFERAKTKLGYRQVADGISWNAVFCMRDILRELPKYYLNGVEPLPPKIFMDILKSKYASKTVTKLSPAKIKRINHFQKLYRKLVDIVSRKTGSSTKKTYLEMTMRSSIINKYDRITGDAILEIGAVIMRGRKKMATNQVIEVIEDFIQRQNLIPEKYTEPHLLEPKKEQKKLSNTILKIASECREGI